MQPIDVHHLGRERVICCWRMGDVLVDPGPESTLETLSGALEGEAPRALLLTHIHLDHAGAAGAIVRRWPRTRVYVHERGAPHLADPSKLLESAGRLYGDDMERLWGEVVPVPEANLHALAGGETVEGLRVEYTPGHASHHVCYLDEESGWAYVGDVAGVRITPAELVLAPTPPPDIDLEAWNVSISRLAGWRPRVLALTHFGAVERPFEHLAAMRDALVKWGTLARELDAGEFEAQVREEADREAGERTAAAYLQAAPPEQLYLGLDRYWRTRARLDA
jgi:glyoxylase-like metal-dependent hydrolase (beta-lactamase superfamily II)